jgi:hypothetical protein
MCEKKMVVVMVMMMMTTLWLSSIQMRQLTSDKRLVAAALQRSMLLVVSHDYKSVGRRDHQAALVEAQVGPTGGHNGI